MVLKSINLKNFRNITKLKLELSNTNFIFGCNGSGKTSVLEAIYYLNNIRSFRTSKSDLLINHNHHSFELYSVFHDGHLYVKRHKSLNYFELNGQKIQKASLIAHINPTFAFHSKSIDFIAGQPQTKRKFLDKTCFYLFNDYNKLYSQYTHCLSQRNALLQKANFDNVQFHYWTDLLQKKALAISTNRDAVLQKTATEFKKLLSMINDRYANKYSELNFHYYQGWSHKTEYKQTLKESYALDRKFKRTHYGPHRAMFTLTLDNHLVADHCSRGELKLIAILLILAQMRVVNKKSIFLIDDYYSEIDHDHQNLIHQLLLEHGGQLIFSGIATPNFSNRNAINTIDLLKLLSQP